MHFQVLGYNLILGSLFTMYLLCYSSIYTFSLNHFDMKTESRSGSIKGLILYSPRCVDLPVFTIFADKAVSDEEIGS